ncbi:MAG: hypothetical protein D6765_12970 [Bacteroidetes bacterium]|nr:MAG: hypothetical protein D6765_12970 [Bacteroidota bacterium]
MVQVRFFGLANPLEDIGCRIPAFILEDTLRVGFAFNLFGFLKNTHWAGVNLWLGTMDFVKWITREPSARVEWGGVCLPDGGHNLSFLLSPTSRDIPYLCQKRTS